jgi:hypothetical protein
MVEGGLFNLYKWIKVKVDLAFNLHHRVLREIELRKAFLKGRCSRIHNYLKIIISIASNSGTIDP